MGISTVKDGVSLLVVYTDGSMAHVSKGADNLEYIAVQEWLANGGVLIAADPAPAKTYQDFRLAAYLAQGVTEGALAVALWDKIAEPSSKHDQAVADIQATRVAIKALYPKP